jgi:peptide/nickel transport system substrate-binding protein
MGDEQAETLSLVHAVVVRQGDEMKKQVLGAIFRLICPSLGGLLVAGGLVMSSATPSLAETPLKGGTLVVARPADIFTFDPYNTQDDPSIFTELTVYERLVRLAADGKGVEPELATAWTIAPDGLTADFTLREGVKFSDGTPLTADDIVFSLTRAIDQKSSWGFLFSPVKSVTKLNEQTLRVHMSEPFAPLLPAFSTFAASIFSKANFQKWGDQAGSHPLGSGAFMLDHWNRGQEVALVRNPYYWQKGKPYLDGVVFRVVGDENARILQLSSGDLGLITNVPANQVDQIKSAGNQVYTISGTVVGNITLNQKKKPLDEPAVRCALAYAIDREAIARVVFFGRAVPAKSVIPSSTFYYDADTGPITYDLAKAKALLASSSVPHGFELTANVPSGDASNLAIAQIWAASLAQIGVKMNIEQVEATTIQDLFNTERFTVDINSWTNDTPDPDEYMGVALDYQPQNGHHSSYRSEEARNLVLAARKEMDPAKRQKLYSQLQRIVNRDCPFLYTVNQDRIFASSPAVQSFVPNSQGKYNFENVWLKK